MKKTVLSELSKLMKIDYFKHNKLLIAKYKGYPLKIENIEEDNIYIISFPLLLNDDFTIININNSLKDIRKCYSNITSAMYNNNSIRISYYATGRITFHINSILSIINFFIEKAQYYNLSSCPFDIGQDVFSSKETKIRLGKNQKKAFIFSILGSLVGIILWIIVGLSGFITSICGIVIPIYTIKGYLKFGNKNKTFYIWTFIVTILAAFIAEIITFKLTSNFNFIKELGIGYIFCLIGYFIEINNNKENF